MSIDGMYSDLDRRVGQLQRRVDSEAFDLESNLTQIKSDLEELGRLPHQIRDLEDELGEAKQETARIEEELEDRVSGTARSLARLGRRVAALERIVRLSEDAHVVDLDQDQDGSLRDLAATVAEGYRVSHQLLSENGRAGLKATGNRLQATRAERREQRAAVLQAATVLASTPASDPQRKTAVRAFHTALPRARTAHERLGPLTDQAEKAQQQLADDDARRARHAKTIEAAHRAENKLRLRLRSRISEAVSGPHLLPVWFATAFGPMPPARTTDQWLNTATDVLAYRLTYHVEDPVAALGTPPDGHRAPRRTAWHQDLTTQLRRWA